MDNRTRIINTVLGKPVDRLPLAFYFGTWEETLSRWETEGLPKGAAWDSELNLDPGFVHVDVNLGYFPAFQRMVLENRERTDIIRDEFGITMEVQKGRSTIPRYIDYPVKNRADWRELKKRLDPQAPERFPKNFAQLAENYNNGDKAVQLGWYPYGLFGTLRDMMGVETLLLTFYDDPALIRDMMDYLTDFWIAIYEKVCRRVRVDAIHMWEDMSGKAGSLISPAMIREFMMPNYQKIKTFALAHRIPIFSLDTDGDCSQLVPLFLECGINLVFPFEVAAGCDILWYRAHYPKLCIMGGIDKREIAKGRAAIDRELSRIDGMFDGPRYIPALDHLAHPEISYGDFKYFVEALRKKIAEHAQNDERTIENG